MFVFAQLAQRSKSLANAKMELATTKQQNQAMEEQVCEQGFNFLFGLCPKVEGDLLNDKYMILPYTTSLGPTAHLRAGGHSLLDGLCFVVC